MRRRRTRRKEDKKRKTVEHGERETWQICSRKRNAAMHPRRPPSPHIPSLRAVSSRHSQKPPPKRLVTIPSMLKNLGLQTPPALIEESSWIFSLLWWSENLSNEISLTTNFQDFKAACSFQPSFRSTLFTFTELKAPAFH